MNSSSRVLVHQLFAYHLQIDETSIKDAHGVEELGLDPLDVVLVVLRLEDFGGGGGDFPVVALAQAKTVGDVVALVDLAVDGKLQRPGLGGRAQARCLVGDAG